MTLLSVLVYTVPALLIGATLWTGISCFNFYRKENKELEE